MCIARLISVSVVYGDYIPISAFPAGILDYSVGGSIHRGAYVTREVHAVVEDARLVDGMYAIAES